MHVGINARAFSVEQPGGAARAGVNLAKALADRDDVTLTLFGHDRVVPAFPDTDVVSTGFPVNSQSYGVLWEQAFLPRIARKAGVDVLLCPSNNGPMVSAPVPVVTWIHGLFAYDGDASLPYTTLQRVRMPRVVANSDAVMTVSETTRDRIADEFDVPADAISVVHNGIDDLFLGDDPGEPVDLPDEYVFFAGAMNRRKNFRGLVDAFRILRAEYDVDHELVLTGPDADLTYERVDTDLDHDDVHHLGFVDRPVLKYVYANADVFAFPSLRESFGLPPVEAMACRTPVVASDRSPLTEILDGGARFVDPTDPESIADGIAEVLTHGDLRRELVDRGRRRAEQFTWDRAASETVEVLRTAIRDG